MWRNNSFQALYLLLFASLRLSALGQIVHLSRHTFGTTVTLANKVTLQNVSKMMGHASTRMTEHYARVMDQTIMEDMEKAAMNLAL